jgi:hypothetical protein
MSNGMAGASAGSAGAGAVIANAIKATGAIVKVDAETFSGILARSEKPVVVTAPGGFMGKSNKYIVSYGGLYFYCISREEIPVPGTAEVIRAKTIWIPG